VQGPRGGRSAPDAGGVWRLGGGAARCGARGLSAAHANGAVKGAVSRAKYVRASGPSPVAAHAAGLITHTKGRAACRARGSRPLMWRFALPLGRVARGLALSTAPEGRKSLESTLQRGRELWGTGTRGGRCDASLFPQCRRWIGYWCVCDVSSRDSCENTKARGGPPAAGSTACPRRPRSLLQSLQCCCTHDYRLQLGGPRALLSGLQTRRHVLNPAGASQSISMRPSSSQARGAIEGGRGTPPTTQLCCVAHGPAVCTQGAPKTKATESGALAAGRLERCCTCCKVKVSKGC
jgi:hypothetical protein